MSDILINEYIINQRFLNLEKSVNKFVKQLQKNGLAKQLQYYRASNSFDVSQYVDLFDQILTEQREHFLLYLHQEIDHEKFLYNQYDEKLKRRNQKCFNETKDLRLKNEKLHQILDTFNNRLSTLKNSQEAIEQTYLKKTEALQGLIDLNKIVQDQQKKILIPLCRQALSDIHDDFTNEINSYISDILKAYKMRLESQIFLRIQNAIFIDHNQYCDEIFKLKNEIDDIQGKNNEFSMAIKNISDCISSLSGIEINDDQDINDQIPKLIDQLKKGIVSKSLNESKKRFLNSQQSTDSKDKKSVLSKLSTDAESFCSSIKEVLDIAISKREKQFEKLDNFGRKKRLNLQKQYEKVLNKLDEINAQRPDHTEIIDEMNISSLSFIEKTKQLDDNIKLLSKSPFISKLNIKSNE